MVISLLSCTRQVDQSDVSSLTLSIPRTVTSSSGSFGALAVTSANLSHLVVNVTGPGLAAPLFLSWDSHDGSNAPPPQFVMQNVPQGTSRLIQVLAIYKDIAANNEVFYYGDQSLAIQSDIVYANINVSELQGYAGQGALAGRLVDSSGVGPTGVVNLYYTPTGKPKMLVHQAEIFAGWFNFFAMNGAAFEYVLDDGTNLFGSAVGTHSTFAHSSILKVATPDIYIEYDPMSAREFRKAELSAFGWFSLGGADHSSVTGSKQICYYGNFEPLDYTYTAMVSGTTVNWLPSATVLGTNYASPVPGSGGVSEVSMDSENLCMSGTTRFDDYLSLDHQALRHHDGALSFQGPFVKRDLGSSERQALMVDHDGTALTIDWEYLPDVQTDGGITAIDGTAIFMRILPGGATQDVRENFKSNKDGVDCSTLSYLQEPFVLVEDVASVSPPMSVISLSYLDGDLDNHFAGNPDYMMEFQDGNIQVLACPYQVHPQFGFRYFQSAAYYMAYGNMTNLPSVTASGTITEGSAGSISISLGSSYTADIYINYATSHFEATASDYTSITGTLTIPAGQMMATLALTSTPDLIFEGDEHLYLDMVVSDAGSASYTISEPILIQDDEATPELNFATAAGATVENVAGGNAHIVVTMSAAAAVDVVFDYYTVDLTAVDGVDYTGQVFASATILAGQTAHTIAMPITDDVLSEVSGETFDVYLNAVSIVALGTTTIHTHTITDNEPSPTVQFSLANDATIESIGTRDIVLNLDYASGVDIVVDYLLSGTATVGVGQDYTISPSSITFAAGETSKTIVANLNDDNIAELDETIILDINAVAGGGATEGAQGTHTLTIYGGDNASISFSAATQSVLENAISIDVVVQLTNPSVQNVTFNYGVDGSSTAISSIDYTSFSGAGTILPMATSYTISVPLVEDAVIEPDETIVINLSGWVGAVAGTHMQHVLTILNDDAIVATKFIIINPTDSVAGTATTVTVQAVDASNNIDTTYNSDVTLLCDGSSAGCGLVNIVSGAGAMNVNDTVAETVNLSLSDTQATGLDVTSTQNVMFVPGGLSHFTVTGITDPHVAGTPVSPTVTAFDAYNNVKTDYTGTIVFSSDDPGSTLPANYTFVLGDSGAKTFTNGVTLVTTGDYYVRVTDGAVNGEQAAISVTPGAPAQLTWSTQPPANIATSVSFGAVLLVRDAYGNVCSSDNSSNVTMTIASGSGGLSGTATVVASSGVVSFAGISLSPAGPFQLRATLNGGPNIDSGVITVTP